MDESKRLMHKMTNKGRIIGYCPADGKWWIGGEINAWFSENELEVIEE